MSNIEAAEKYLPRKEAAAYIGERVRGRPYSEITIINWEKDGRGPPATRVGRDVAYFVPSIEKWLRSREGARGSTSANAA